MGDLQKSITVFSGQQQFTLSVYLHSFCLTHFTQCQQLGIMF